MTVPSDGTEPGLQAGSRVHSFHFADGPFFLAAAIRFCSLWKAEARTRLCESAANSTHPGKSPLHFARPMRYAAKSLSLTPVAKYRPSWFTRFPSTQAPVLHHQGGIRCGICSRRGVTFAATECPGQSRHPSKSYGYQQNAGYGYQQYPDMGNPRARLPRDADALSRAIPGVITAAVAAYIPPRHTCESAHTGAQP